MKAEPTNQYMFLVRGGPCHSTASPEQMQVQMTEVYTWIDELTKKGIFSAAQPLTSEGRVVSGGNSVTVSDGISMESKESVGGFFIVNVATMEEAVDIARNSPMLRHGKQLEVRQIAALKCD